MHGYGLYGLPRFPPRPRVAGFDLKNPPWSWIAAFANADLTHTSESALSVEYDELVASHGSDLSLLNGDVLLAKAGIYAVNAQCYVTIPPASGTLTQVDFQASGTNIIDTSLAYTALLAGLEQDLQITVTSFPFWNDTPGDVVHMTALIRWNGTPGSVDTWGHRINVMGPFLEF